ncbi:hypothetical protein ACFX1T_044921 [Malus domestica]
MMVTLEFDIFESQIPQLISKIREEEKEKQNPNFNLSFSNAAVQMLRFAKEKVPSSIPSMLRCPCAELAVATRSTQSPGMAPRYSRGPTAFQANLFRD